MTFKTKLGVYYGDARYIFPHIPAEYAKPFLSDKNRRVICILNDKIRLHSALMHDGKGDFFININKATRKKLNIEDGDEVRITLEPDTSKYGMEVCEEMEEMLAQDPEFKAYFDKLTPGKQRRLIYLSGKAKTSDTRLRKTLIIADSLKINQGNLNLEELNNAFKQ